MCASVLTSWDESSTDLKVKKDDASKLFTIKEASVWASKYLNKKVTTSNISYLIQYGRIKKIADGLEGLIFSLRKIDIIKAWRMLINKGC